MNKTPDKDGIRRYGKGHISNGMAEDKTKCQEEVSDGGRWLSYHQCRKPRGFGPEKQFCKVHDPKYIEAKDKARQAKWDLRHKRDRVQWAGHRLLRLLIRAAPHISDDEIRKEVEQEIIDLGDVGYLLAND